MLLIRGKQLIYMSGSLSESSEGAARPAQEDHVLVLCHMLSNRIGHVFAPALRELGLSLAEWRVLLTLASHGSSNGGEIAKRWAMNKMTVSRAIDGLRQAGLIERRQNATDKRVVDVGLTEAGRQTFDRLIPIANQRYRELMVSLTSSETDQLHGILMKLIARADTISE